MGEEWGETMCGCNAHAVFDKPRRIEFFDDFVVEEIKVGRRHNYVRTRCGKNYMWGDNEDMGCIKFDGEKFIARPHRIDDIVKMHCEIDKVVDVELGYYNTLVFCV